MEPADSIGRIGFRRWYERRLLESHGWLVTSLLCLILILSCLEELSFRGPVGRLLLYAGVIFCAGAAAVYGIGTYLRTLGEALSLSEHATCGGCGAYARFRMISPSRVRCRKCGNEWLLIDPGVSG